MIVIYPCLYMTCIFCLKGIYIFSVCLLLLCISLTKYLYSEDRHRAVILGMCVNCRKLSHCYVNCRKLSHYYVNCRKLSYCYVIYRKNLSITNERY